MKIFFKITYWKYTVRRNVTQSQTSPLPVFAPAKVTGGNDETGITIKEVTFILFHPLLHQVQERLLTSFS